MKLVFGFIYNGNYYYVVDSNDKIYIGLYEDNQFTVIPNSEKESLRNILKFLLVKKFDIKKLSEYNLTPLNNDSFDFKGGLNNAIVLELNQKTKKNLIKNSKKLNEKKNNKVLRNIFVIFIISITLVVGVLIFINKYEKPKNEPNKELLEKYTYKKDENLKDFYNMSYKIIEIKNKTFDNLFTDTSINFKNSYNISFLNGMSNEYYSISNYDGDVFIQVKTTFSNNNNLNKYDFNIIESNYNVSVYDLLARHNINTNLDLMHQIILNSNKKIDGNSTEREIIDNYIFEILRPLVIPFDNSDINKQILFFKGDKNGYAHIMENKINIFLINNNYEYEIIYDYNGKNVNKLTANDVIDIVSSIEFNSDFE